MNYKIFLPTLLSIFLTTIANSQNVSTLLTDSLRDFESIHWNNDGRIYSADYTNGRIYQISTNGTVATVVQGIPNLVGGGFDTAGTFYFSSVANGNVYRLNPDNTYTIIASGLNQPVGVLPSSSPDTLYVAEYGGNSVSKISVVTGNVTSWVSGNGINGPDAIIYNDQNEIIIANFNNSSLFKISETGIVSPFATIPISGYLGYCTSVNNNIYVPSIAGKQLFRITPTGIITSIAGTGVAGTTDGNASSASFIFPNGICHNPNGDTLLITDRHRIRVVTNFQETNTLDEIRDRFEISLYPNAATDFLTISMNNYPISLLQWEIYTLSGKRILQGSVIPNSTKNNSFTISISTLPPGKYQLRILTENNTWKAKTFIKVN